MEKRNLYIILKFRVIHVIHKNLRLCHEIYKCICSRDKYRSVGKHLVCVPLLPSVYFEIISLMNHQPLAMKPLASFRYLYQYIRLTSYRILRAACHEVSNNYFIYISLAIFLKVIERKCLERMDWRMRAVIMAYTKTKTIQ